MSRRVMGPAIVFVFGTLCGCDSTVFYSMFPPEGYYEPVLAMDVNSHAKAYSSDIVHKYKGRYSVSLVFDRPNDVGTGYDLEHLDIHCTMSHGESTVDIPCGTRLLPFWGEESGISLAVYQVPDMAPQNENVVFRLEFQSEEQLKSVEARFGPIGLRIAKWSDL
jgi:hypothetical protein